MKNWFNDGVWKCEHCNATFKVYNLGEENDVQGCPYCLVTGVKLTPCDDEGNEEIDE